MVIEFFSLDGPIRANRFADSRESPDSRESFQGSQTEPSFLRIALRGAKKIANHRFEAIRANRLHVMNIVFFFLRIDSRESIGANRPDSRCESPGHLGSSGETGEGATTLLHFPSAPDPFFKASKTPSLTVRVATP